MATSGIPIIDIAPFLNGNADEKLRVAGAFGKAFEEVGFAAVVGHGVPEDLRQSIFRTARAFFDLPVEEKARSSLPSRIKDRGYLALGVESVAKTRNAEAPPDLCEALMFMAMHQEPATLPSGGVSEVTGNMYPARPADLGEIYRRYFLTVRRLADDLMRISAVALGLPEAYFVPFMDRRTSRLRTIHYPDQKEEPLPGQLRYGAHSDYGSLTILLQDNAPGGLQVSRDDGSWTDVRPIPGSFIINIGDLMARWTNDRWRSTLHRVANPPRDASGSTRRMSVAFFSGTNDDAMIECLPTCRDENAPAKYRPVRASDHVREKYDVSMIEADRSPADAPG